MTTPNTELLHTWTAEYQEGYLRCVADYAPLLEAARTTLTRLRVAYRPAFEDDAAVREEPQHSIQLLLEAALAATGAISQ